MREAVELQQRGSASPRVRRHLYATAARLASSAMWAAVDGRHLDQAVTLSGLSGDAATNFWVWSQASSLYKHVGQHGDALAAAEASRATRVVRQDPFYASLAHARLAVRHAGTGELTAARRSLGRAQDALDRSDPTEPRPSWMGFWGQGDLHLHAVITCFDLGQWADAESHAHRALALLPRDTARDRALLHAYLALAQLHQGELEPAVSTALVVPTDIARRVGRLVDGFGDRLRALAPGSAQARAWTEYAR
ncbi:hypothetical protein AQ490_20125 [Wenjunlia vitaminophila]|uniref:Uncharacterized protein n=1 Tax=Wenjunlia vitaminophila TaxID=76728 RepID=A0A0T6LUB9_WENVI|nr:hypothetical protein AQ490_20125 [Wenjunlia vitaminophila]